MLKRVKEFKFLAIFTVLLLPFTASPIWGQQFKITAESGVPEMAKENAQQAVEATLLFFKEVCHFELKRNYRIILVPNKESYIAALMREDTKVNQKEAERRARTTMGWQTYDVIIQNVGGLPNDRRRIYNMSHEVTHKFQIETCSGNCQRVMWIHDGTATAIGNHVVEMLGIRPLAEVKKSWIRDFHKLPARPTLKELKSKEDWFKALDKYGSEPVNQLAGLAVFNLIQEKGYESLFVYFKRINDWREEDFFKMAFGLDLSHYENGFNTLIEKQMGKLSEE